MLEIIFVNDKSAPETVLRIRKIQGLSLKWAKSQTKSVLFFTKYSILFYSGRKKREIYVTKQESGRRGKKA